MEMSFSYKNNWLPISEICWLQKNNLDAVLSAFLAFSISSRSFFCIYNICIYIHTLYMISIFCMHCTHMYKKFWKLPNVHCFTCIVRLNFPGFIIFRFFSASTSPRIQNIAPASLYSMDGSSCYISVVISREVFMVFPNDLKSMCKDNYAFTLYLK